MGGTSSNKAKKKAEAAAQAAARAAELEAQRQAEEAKQKEMARKRRGRISLIKTSMEGLADKNRDLKRKNLLGE